MDRSWAGETQRRALTHVMCPDGRRAFVDDARKCIGILTQRAGRVLCCRSRIGETGSAMAWGICSIIVGGLTARYDPRWILRFGTVVAGAGQIVIGRMTTSHQFVFFYTTAGIGYAGMVRAMPQRAGPPAQAARTIPRRS